MAGEIIKLEPFDGKTVEQLTNIEILNVPNPSGLEVESLSVLHEVRKELANVYKENKGAIKTVETLTTKLSDTENKYSNACKTIEVLKKDLDIYKTREAETAKAVYNKRLEMLSKNFTELGQEKTIEELSKLSKSVINEFESITALALQQKSEERLDGVTIPTQSMGKKTVEQLEAKPQETQKEFLVGIANKLTGQQNVEGPDSKRTKYM